MPRAKHTWAYRTIRDWIDGCEDALLVADGLDSAIIGVTAYQPGRPQAVVYDYERCVAHFIAQGMTDEDAREWMEFNVVGAWHGEQTPIYLITPAPGEIRKLS